MAQQQESPHHLKTIFPNSELAFKFPEEFDEFLRQLGVEPTHVFQLNFYEGPDYVTIHRYAVNDAGQKYTLEDKSTIATVEPLTKKIKEWPEWLATALGVVVNNEPPEVSTFGDTNG